MAESIVISKYIKLFSIAYFLFLVVFGVALALLDIDGNAGTSIGSLVASIFIAVSRFVEDNKRIPNKTEKSKLVWYSFFSSWIISLLLFIAVVLFYGGIASFEFIPDISLDNLITFGVVFFVISLIYLAGIYFCYGSFAKTALKSLQKKEKLAS
ncbi:MAG: ABZJ_00895 family protein [Methylophagaceae bacterium]